jgi:hypothetical protein
MATLPILDQTQAMIGQAPGSAARAVSPQPIERTGLRAAANYQSTVAQSLDRISNTLFGVNRKLAEDAGYQYVAENPLTPEQLQAIARGDVRKVVTAGSGINIQQNVIRKARAFEIAGHADIEARKVIIEMLPDIEQGNISSKDAQIKLATVLDGYSRSLVQIDPEASLKFRATIASLGNTVLEKAAVAELKRVKAENNIKLELDFQRVQQELEEVFSRSSWGEFQDGTPLSPDQFADAIKQSFITKAALIGGQEQALSYVQKFPAAIRQAKVNAVTRYITTDTEMTKDPLDTYGRLRRGDVGMMSPVYQSMDQDDKAKVISNLMSDVSNKASLAEKKRKDEELVAKDAALDLYEQWLQSNNPAEKRRLQQDLLDLNVLTLEQTRNLLDPDTAKTSPNVIFFLEDQIDSGVITNSADLLNAGSKRGVTGKDMVDLRRRLSGRVTSEVKSTIRRLAGIPEGLVNIDPKGAEAKKYLDIQQRLETERAKAVAEGKPFDQLGVLRQIEIEGQQKRDTAAAKAARSRLEVYEKKTGAKITSQTLPFLREQVQSGKSDIKPRELQQIERLVKQAEGLE